VELLRQMPRLDAVFVAVGGGGLIAGIGAHLKATSPLTTVIGSWPVNSPVLHRCLRAGRIITVEEKPTLSVSTSGNLEPDTITLALCDPIIDRSVLVTEDEILDALRLVYRESGLIGEGAAGVAIAAFRKVAHQYAGKAVAIIICGGNADSTLIQRITQD
jgi:threonine dehydratase